MIRSNNAQHAIPALFGIFFVIILSFIFVFGRIGVLYHRSIDTHAQLNGKISELRDSVANQHTKYDSLMLAYRKTHPDVIWIARAIYSETDRRNEKELVAWVIRNRFEFGYGGAESYKDVVLQPRQFSAFNRNRSFRFFYSTLGWSDNFENPDRTRRWKTALEIAAKVRFADAEKRPFDPKTFYFYSEVSMPAYKKHPSWASMYEQVDIETLPKAYQSIPKERFRFFKDPDCYRCTTLETERKLTASTETRNGNSAGIGR